MFLVKVADVNSRQVAFLKPHADCVFPREGVEIWNAGFFGTGDLQGIGKIGKYLAAGPYTWV
jgi:hypothetical protein